MEAKLKQLKRLKKTAKQVSSVQQSDFVDARYGEADETEVSGSERRET